VNETLLDTFVYILRSQKKAVASTPDIQTDPPQTPGKSTTRENPSPLNRMGRGIWHFMRGSKTEEMAKSFERYLKSRLRQSLCIQTVGKNDDSLSRLFKR